MNLQMQTSAHRQKRTFSQTRRARRGRVMQNDQVTFFHSPSGLFSRSAVSQRLGRLVLVRCRRGSRPGQCGSISSAVLVQVKRWQRSCRPSMMVSLAAVRSLIEASSARSSSVWTPRSAVRSYSARSCPRPAARSWPASPVFRQPGEDVGPARGWDRMRLMVTLY